MCVSGVYADKIGIEAAEMLLRNIRHNGCVDEFLQDQVRHTPADISGFLMLRYSLDSEEIKRRLVIVHC